MTETPEPPPDETTHDPTPAPEPPARRGLAPWLNALGFLILAVAIAWVWRMSVGQPDAQLGALEQQLGALKTQIARLEQRPVQSTTDLDPLNARVAALEQHPASGSPAAPPADLAPLTARVTALEQHPPQGTQAPASPDLAPLEARIAALEARQPAETQLAARLDALAARIDALDTAQRSAQSDAARRKDADDARLAAIERAVGQIPALADRLNRQARVQAAQLALERGQALGDIPGAPPALARFATAKPPTEAALRLAFPAAAQAAVAAARPSTEGKPMLTRLWAQAQDLVTIREGDRVLVGDPVAGVLGRARALLDTGDLAGAAAVAGSLTGPAADAMAGWLAQARSLLDARAALSDWAAHA